MFGSLAGELLPARLGIDRKRLVVVSIMPCTAKKYEARLQRFRKDGRPDVDYVLTTQELTRMIEEAGLRFNQLRPESLDMPFGFKTGAGVIFGNSGGVTEAVLRYAVEKLTGVTLDSVDFEAVRGEEGLREATLDVGKEQLRIAIVHGLANARKVAEQARAGKSPYDLVEVMACPGGCIGGAGQPVCREREARQLRTRGLYEADKMLELHKSQENHFVKELYKEELGEIGGERAHELLHTHYHSRRRIADTSLSLVDGEKSKLQISVCVGTNCMVRGAQTLLHDLIHYVEERGLQDLVDVKASFCFEWCDKGPTVMVGEKLIHKCTLKQACEAMDEVTAAEPKNQ
jgi:NADH-quinone oxidoreductase subunit G